MNQPNNSLESQKTNLKALIDKLQALWETMQSDQRCSDDAFLSGVQLVFSEMQQLRQQYTELETQYFESKTSDMANIVEAGHLEADHLKQLLDEGATTVQIVGAIEQITKTLHP